jgi:hypothetical protein
MLSALFKRYIVPVLLAGLLVGPALSGCDANKPPLDEERYIMILAELELAYTTHRVTNDSILTSAFIKDIFRHYGTTSADFALAHSMYERDIRGQTRRYDQVAIRLTEENYRLSDVEVNLRNRPQMGLSDEISDTTASESRQKLELNDFNNAPDSDIDP